MKNAKATYYISKFDSNCSYVEAVKVEGYTVELLVDGIVYRFGVHKDPESHPANLWTVTEINTGYTTAPTKYKTRKEAVEYINSPKHIEAFGNYVSTKRCMYEAQCRMLKQLIESGKPMDTKKHKEQIDKWTNELAAEVLAESKANIAAAAEKEAEERKASKPKTSKSKASKPKAPKRKPKATSKPKATEVVVTTARVDITPEGVKATPIESHVEVVEQPNVEQVALTATLDALKEWATDKSGVRVEQAREGSPLWVCGKLTKEQSAELKGAGFKHGTSKKYGRGYWANPIA